MKRWICLFLSLAVCVSALSLGVHAEEPELDIQELYVYSSIVSSTFPDFSVEIPQDGQITDRGITNNTNQRYSRIKNFSFTCPAASWFLIDFDIIAEDNSNSGTTQVPAVSASRNITSYIRSDFSVSGSISPPTIFRAEVRRYSQSGGAGGFVHYSIFGMNTAITENNIVITYNNPITVTADLISPTSLCFTQRITNVNCKVSFAMEQLYDVLSSIYETLDDTYSEVVSIGDTLGNFYNEFHQYWQTVANTYIRLIYQAIYASTFNSYDGIQQNQDGTLSLISGSHRPMIAINNNLSTISQLLGHQLEWENKATEAGADDAYSDLNDSADFGSLSDFSGAGAVASWSSGSFSNGLSGIWDFFSNDTFYDLDTTDNRHDSSIYHEDYYQNNLSDYFDIVGSDYDGSASD